MAGRVWPPAVAGRPETRRLDFLLCIFFTVPVSVVSGAVRCLVVVGGPGQPPLDLDRTFAARHPVVWGWRKASRPYRCVANATQHRNERLVFFFFCSLLVAPAASATVVFPPQTPSYSSKPLCHLLAPPFAPARSKIVQQTSTNTPKLYKHGG